MNVIRCCKAFPAVFAAALLAALFVLGCSDGLAGGSAKEAGYSLAARSADADFSAAGQADAGSAEEAAADIAESPDPSVTGKTRKLARSASINIEADKSFIDGDGRLGKAAQKIEELVTSYGGYIQESREDNSSLNCTVKIPGGRYDDFISGVGVLGKEIFRRENAEDVTLKYYDLEGRLATKKELLATFRSYLAKAKSVEEIMQVETRIADLQNEIDWLGTQLTQLASIVDYATVNLYVYNPRDVRPYTLGDRIADLFGSFGGFAKGGLLALIGIVIFGIPIIIALLLAYWLLFGKIGLLKKAFRLASGKSAKTKKEKNT